MRLQIYGQSTTTFSKPTRQEVEHPIISFFKKHKSYIQGLLDRQSYYARGEFQDYLNIETVMNNVFLKTLEIPEEKLTDVIIDKIVKNTIKQNCQDYESGRFSRKHNTIQSNEDNDTTHSYIFHNPDNRKSSNDISLPNTGTKIFIQSRAERLRPSQEALLNISLDGGSRDEISEITGRKKSGINPSLEIVRQKLVDSLGSPPHKSIDAIKWLKLSPNQKLTMSCYLSGINQDSICNEIGVSANTASNLISTASHALGITINDIHDLRRETKLSEESLKTEREFSLINFVFLDKEPLTFKSSATFSKTLFDLMCFLTPLQKTTLELSLEGLRNTDIAHLTKRRKQEVYHTLKAAQKTLREKHEEFIKTNQPEDFDKIKWMKTREQSKKAILLYIQGNNYACIAKKMHLEESSVGVLIFEGLKTLESTKEILDTLQIKNIINSNKKNKWFIQSSIINTVYSDAANLPLKKQLEISKTLCKLIFTRKNTNLRPFKLFILGLRKFQIAKTLGMSQSDVIRSINTTTKALKETFEEFTKTPEGLNPYKWIKLYPKARETVSLYINGHSAEQIKKELKIKDETQVRKYLNTSCQVLGINIKNLTELRKSQKAA